MTSYIDKQSAKEDSEKVYKFIREELDVEGYYDARYLLKLTLRSLKKQSNTNTGEKADAEPKDIELDYVR